MSWDGKYVVIHDDHAITRIYDSESDATSRAGFMIEKFSEGRKYKVYRLVEVKDEGTDVPGDEAS